MSDSPKKRILIVDDDPGVRMTVSMLLVAEGYEIATAEDGFDALLRMKSKVPDLVVSDLNMPRMSGFELLSVVRRRFPEVQVLAMSGAYHAGDSVPGGVIADAFYAKGIDNPRTMLRLVADLLNTSASQKRSASTQSAPVWVPRNGNDSGGAPYVVLTCTECLRSFPVDISTNITASVMETDCIFCVNQVRYIIDSSFSVASPVKRKETPTESTSRAVA